MSGPRGPSNSALSMEVSAHLALDKIDVDKKLSSENPEDVFKDECVDVILKLFNMMLLLTIFNKLVFFNPSFKFFVLLFSATNNELNTFTLFELSY